MVYLELVSMKVRLFVDAMIIPAQATDRAKFQSWYLSSAFSPALFDTLRYSITTMSVLQTAVAALRPKKLDPIQ